MCKVLLLPCLLFVDNWTSPNTCPCQVPGSASQMTRSSGKSAYQGRPHNTATVRPRMQAAGLQCLKLQIADASPDPQTRAFPGTQFSRRARSPNGRSRFDRFDFDVARHFALDIASVSRAQSPCWTELVVTYSVLVRIGSTAFRISVSIRSAPLWWLKPSLYCQKAPNVPLPKKACNLRACRRDLRSPAPPSREAPAPRQRSASAPRGPAAPGLRPAASATGGGQFAILASCIRLRRVALDR